ncbi:myomegalin isoform X4 [Rhincodon typus]|uniref:myomegalin isoform X4 n=1 Tax=Rhincodon typus TaxID=259920 RepID=UPI00202F0D07|nr:myomegalin isoform X4 [Rhincodon typus]
MDWGWEQDETWKCSTPGRDYLSEDNSLPSTSSNVTTLLRDTKESGLPLQTHTLREFEKNIELKVEVESLKRELNEKTELLERASKAVENLHNQNEADIYQKYEERQLETEHVQAILHNKIQLLQEEAKLAKKEVEKMTAVAEAEKLQSLELEEKLNNCNQENQEKLKLWETNEKALTEKNRIIDQLTQALRTKDVQLGQLNKENQNVEENHVDGLEYRVEELSDTLRQKESEVEDLQDELGREKLRTQQEMQNLIEEQQQQLNQYESAAGQCVAELQKAQVQVHGLQGRIQETESANKMLQENLREMESELKEMRYTLQKQDRTQLELKEALKNKEKEVEELYCVIDGQNENQSKLREMLHRSQIENVKRCASCQTTDGQPAPPHAQQQAELLELQNASFSNQLELQQKQRLIRQKEYELIEAKQRKELLETELEEMYQQKEATITHNQELRNTLQQVRQEFLEKEQHYQALEREHQREVHVQEENIQCLKERLQDKEHFLQQYIELFECQQSEEQSGEARDALVDKLRKRIKERDKALEHAIDEKFSTLEKKESEIQQLHLVIREKEKDLDRFRCIFSNNEETINSLENLMKGKDLELEQISIAYKNLQWLKQEMEEKHAHFLKEKDAVNSQLQAALRNSNKEVKDLTIMLMNKVTVGSDNVMEQLRLRLQLKERMLQEALTDRSTLTTDHEQEVTELLQTINSRDQQMKDATEKLIHTFAEKNHELRTLRHQLVEKDREAANFTKQNVSSLEIPTEIARLKELLQEKDRIIHELVQDNHSKNEPSPQPDKIEASEPVDTQPKANGREAVQPTLDEDEAMADPEQEDIKQIELDQIKEELQLALRKEKETRLELTRLQSALANQGREFQCQTVKMEALSSNIPVKEECFKDLQMKQVQPCESPEIERLTQELLVLRERVAEMESSTQANIRKKHHQLIWALEEQVQEQLRLSEALRSERQLYISLVKFHNQTDSSDREDLLQAELLAIQALRGQLEETLKRSQEQISRLERESEMPADSGGGGMDRLGSLQEHVASLTEGSCTQAT